MKVCAHCKHSFYNSPIITGDNICPTCSRMNDITFWYPVLFRNKIPVPKTIIIHTDLELLPLIDGKTVIGYGNFLDDIVRAIGNIGLPVFLRTGYTSNKHDWENSCFITNKKYIFSHVYNLLEFSCMMNIDRVTPYDFWAVREIIETKPYFNYFHGNMPITKERRYFVENGKVKCHHSYWDVDIFKGVKKVVLGDVNSLHKNDELVLNAMAEYISTRFSGYWSIDFLKGKNNQWYVTDMALGAQSYHHKHKPKEETK